MHTKKLMLPAIIVTSLFGLVACGCGCGSSDSSGSNDKNPIMQKDTPKKNNKPVIKKGGSNSSGTKSVKFYDIFVGSDSAELTEAIVYDGNVKRTETLLFGKKEKQSTNNEYYLAPNFEAVMPANDEGFIKKISKTTKVLSKNNFTWYIKSNNGKSLKLNMLLKEVDISGKTEKDKNIELETVHSDKFTYKFPKGSSCYVVNASHNFTYFEFDDDKHSTRYKSVQEWYDYNSENLYNKKIIAKKTLKVGDNNQYTATYLQLAKTDTNKSKEPIWEYPAIVEYKGKLYDADYIFELNHHENTDPSKDKVYCDSYNETGANYLGNQIKTFLKNNKSK